MHFAVSIDLDDDLGRRVGEPDQVYLTFKKEDWRESEQLSINAQAQYSAEDGGSFVGTVDFSQQFDLVNGKYRVQVVALDSSLQSKTESWDLGSLNVWFKEGRSETNNQRMNENYFLKKEIIA